MPHNLYLTTKYDAHVNVEICNTIVAVKYLFKYVYKGSDKVTFSLENPASKEEQNNFSSDSVFNKNKDEVKTFLDARYVSASEAVLRSLGFQTNGQSPHTIRLPVHLEDLQNVQVSENAPLKEVLNKNHETQLTQYFKLSNIDPEAADLFYYQMPLKCIWHSQSKTWSKRKKYLN